MFNSYSCNVTSNPTANIDISSVSGTLVKTLKDSYITRFHMDSKNAERRKVETELLRLGGSRKKIFNKTQYCIRCFKTNNYYTLYCSEFNDAFIQGIIWLDTLDKIKHAIYEIGEDRIKKYLFGVED